MALGSIVKLDGSDLDHIEGNDGNLFKLGCLKPEAVTLSYPLLANNIEVYNLDDARRAWEKRSFKARQVFDKSYIQNQKSHGSCNGYACVGGLSKARAFRGLKYVKLSGSALYSLMNGNRDRGSLLKDGMDKLTTVGAIPETMGGWDKIYKSQYPKDIWEKVAYRFKAFECCQISSEAELVTALLNNFCCIVAVHVNSSFMRIGSNGIVGAVNGVGNHSVHLDDLRYFNGEWQFDLPNSWGPDGWGEEGRGWISWNKHLQKTVNYHEFFAIRSTLNDPEDDEFPIIELDDGLKVEIPVEFPIAI